MPGSNLDYSVDQMADMFGWSSFRGFTGETCSLCQNRANVPASPSWFCECGHLNLINPDQPKPLHETPEYGPAKAQIEKAAAIAKGEADDC